MTSHLPAKHNIYKSKSRSNINKEENMNAEKSYLTKMFLITLCLTLLMFLSLLTFFVNAQRTYNSKSAFSSVTISSYNIGPLNEVLTGNLKYTDSVENSDNEVTQNERYCFTTQTDSQITGNIQFSSEAYFMIKKQPTDWSSEKYIGYFDTLNDVILAPDYTSNKGFSFNSKYERFCVYMWGNDDRPIKYILNINSK